MSDKSNELHSTLHCKHFLGVQKPESEGAGRISWWAFLTTFCLRSDQRAGHAESWPGEDSPVGHEHGDEEELHPGHPHVPDREVARSQNPARGGENCWRVGEKQFSHGCQSGKGGWSPPMNFAKEWKLNPIKYIWKIETFWTDNKSTGPFTATMWNKCEKKCPHRHFCSIFPFTTVKKHEQEVFQVDKEMLVKAKQTSLFLLESHLSFLFYALLLPRPLKLTLPLLLCLPDAQPAREVHPAGEDDDLHREAFPRWTWVKRPILGPR